MSTSARVLVVDDDEYVLRRYRSVLASATVTVEGARTDDEAVEILARQAFDVVVIEYRMPGSDGLAVLRVIKDRWPDIEVVLVSGAPSVEHAKQAIRLGAYDYLAKPVSFDEVSTVVAHAAIQKKWALRRLPRRDPAQPTHEGELS